MDVDPSFLAFLNSEEAHSYDGTLLEEVEAAINSYNGAPYGDEEDGRSQAVSRDVAETIDYMLTSLMDVMAATDHVVEFEPQSQADVEVCDDATQAMHYWYRRKAGFRLMHDWGKAGLAEKIGVVKSCVERRKKRVEGIMPALLMPEDPKAEGIVGASPIPDSVDEMGQPTHFHVAQLQDSPVEFPDYFIPLEEFRVSRDALHDLDTAVYVAHITQKSLSDLAEMGFDTESIATAQSTGTLDPHFTGLSVARDDGRSLLYVEGNDRTGVNRKVWLNEEYVLYDLDGDGISERLCVHRVGNTILTRGGQLAIEPTDYQPFEYWCPFPMQGRLIGQSLADKVIDLQRINTAILRNGLDSIYSQVSPGHYVSDECQNEHTIDDLLTVRPNRLVRYTGQQPPLPETKNDISQIAFAAMEQMIRIRESRTGITRLNKGVDEDTLNDTARGQQMLMARGQQMERYVIRNFAEGVARLFRKKAQLMRKYSPPFEIRVDGQFRQVDPSQWPEDMDIQIKVGLGSGSKQDRVMGLQTIGQVQGMLKMAGSPIVSDDNIYNAAVGLSRALGLQPNDLFTEPPKDENGNPIPQQQPPDPKVQALMAQVQVKQQAIEAQREANAAKLQQAMAQHMGEAQLEAMRQHMEAALEVRQQNLQAFIDQQQMAIDAHKHAAQLDSQQKIAKMRPGGKLDQ